MKDAATAQRDHWEFEAHGMAAQCNEAADILAAALGYPDRHHTDAPPGVVILLWLATKAAVGVTNQETKK